MATTDIATKSIGQLFDELVTNAFKSANALDLHRSMAEFDKRGGQLRRAIHARLPDVDDIAERVHAHCLALFRWHSSFGLSERGLTHELHDALADLCTISLATWRAQEIVMGDGHDSEVVRAAREAQRCNAARTARIRDIDRLLGESGITITTKTYG